MSEAVAQAPSAGSATPTTQSTPAAQAAPGGKPAQVQPGKIAEAAAAGQENPAPGAITEEEWEEIKIGSTTGKVNKTLAKTIKELERGFHSKSNEMATVKQYLVNLAKEAKTNPAAADALFEQLGIDADAYSQTRLAKKLEREMMDPNERKAQDLEKELESFRDKERKSKEKEESDKKTAVETQEGTKLRTEIFEAWKGSGLPPEPEFGAWIAAEIMRADKQGQDLPAKEAAAIVKEKFVALFRRLSSVLPPEQLEEHLGADPLKKWREFDVKRVTNKAPKTGSSGSRPGGSPASARNQQGKKALSEEEYREYFKALANS